MSRTLVFTVARAAGLLVFASGCRRLEEGEEGACLEVHKISGADFEDGQDKTSVQTISASYIGPATRDTYLTLQSNSSGYGEFEFYFSPPALLAEDPALATSMQVEFLAVVPTEGSGGNWLVDIYNRTDDKGWATIGDFSATLSNWSPVLLTVTDTPLTDFIDYEGSSDILVRVYTNSDVTDTTQVYIDFTQLTTSSSAVPPPSPAIATPLPDPSPSPPAGAPPGGVPFAPIACIRGYPNQVDTPDDEGEDGYYSAQAAATSEGEYADADAEMMPL
eukprot:g10033.t1